LDALRRERLRPTSLDEVHVKDAAAGPEEALIRKEQSQAVQAALLTLSVANRTILVLREYGGLSYAEIATALDIPTGTVMSRLNYARNGLRKLLQHDYGETK